MNFAAIDPEPHRAPRRDRDPPSGVRRPLSGTAGAARRRARRRSARGGAGRAVARRGHRRRASPRGRQVPCSGAPRARRLVHSFRPYYGRARIPLSTTAIMSPPAAVSRALHIVAGPHEERIEHRQRPQAGRNSQRERGSQRWLRLMAWVAVAAGRRATRALLHPIALYFLLADGDVRRSSRLYLGRALGRPPGWRDVYRHLFTFAATVLDRVYLLRECFDEFEVEACGVEAIMRPFAARRGRARLRRPSRQLRGAAHDRP